MKTESINFTMLTQRFPKLIVLERLLTSLITEGLMIAFSGGVDSGFLLWSAQQVLSTMKKQQQKGNLLALMTVSPSVPTWEVEAANTFANDLSVELIIINSQELKDENYLLNDAKRCYFCKRELFTIAIAQAKKFKFKYIAYGYNATDKKDIRFGHVAACENNIYSPLLEAGLEKKDIREILSSVGLPLADKPASPCLASRVMTGVRISEDKLQHIESMEAILREAGLRLYRVRLHEENIAQNKILKYFRIEVAAEEMQNVIAIRHSLVDKATKLGYQWVNLDLSGYKMGGGTLL
jgi:uncharacterized protein